MEKLTTDCCGKKKDLSQVIYKANAYGGTWTCKEDRNHSDTAPIAANSGCFILSLVMLTIVIGSSLLYYYYN